MNLFQNQLCAVLLNIQNNKRQKIAHIVAKTKAVAEYMLFYEKNKCSTLCS